MYKLGKLRVCPTAIINLTRGKHGESERGILLVHSGLRACRRAEGGRKRTLLRGQRVSSGQVMPEEGLVVL